ncbi:MAG: hypothetical protein S0880_20555 [Actinomycetota bacterium]|nr:hypothetical protein [Actinomycetota bacterium]
MASTSDAASGTEASDQPVIIDDATMLAELRAENERLRAELAAQPSPGRRRLGAGAARRIGMVVLLAVAVVLLVAANVATWVERTALDNDEFTAVASDIVRREAVTDALAIGVTERIFERVDAAELARDALPENAQVLAGPLAGAVRSFTEDAVREVLRSDQFAVVWSEAVRLSHENAVSVITGEGDLARVEDGQVVLDLDELVERVLARLDERGLTLFENGAPVELGTFVLFESGQVETLERSVDWLDRLATWLPLLAVGLAVGVVLVAIDRRRAVAQVGLAVAAAMALTLVIVRIARREALGQIVLERRRAAADEMWDAVIDGLRTQTVAVLLVGLILALGAWALGPSAWATNLRSALSGGISSAGEGRATGWLPEGVVAFAAAHRGLLQGGIAAAAFVLLIALPRLTPFIVVVVAILTALLVGAVAAVAARHRGDTAALDGGDHHPVGAAP